MNSKVSPWGICTSCADTVSSLLATYRRIYSLRRATLIITHIILTSAIIHLLRLPDPSATKNVVQAIISLKETIPANAFARRCPHILRTLAKQWGLTLPEEVCKAFAEIPQEPMTNGSDHEQSPLKVESYLHPNPDPVQRQQYDSARPPSSELPFPTYRSYPKPSHNAEEFFWSPFPDRSIPLQANPPGGPMDISAMLDVSNQRDHQLNRDGFRVASMNDTLSTASSYNHLGSQWTQT